MKMAKAARLRLIVRVSFIIMWATLAYGTYAEHGMYKALLVNGIFLATLIIVGILAHHAEVQEASKTQDARKGT